MKNQLAFDLSSKISVVEDEKKDQLISFRVGESFKKDLERIAKAKRCHSLSALIEEYVIECFTEDLKKILLINSKREMKFSITDLIRL